MDKNAQYFEKELARLHQEMLDYTYDNRDKDHVEVMDAADEVENALAIIRDEIDEFNKKQ